MLIAVSLRMAGNASTLFKCFAQVGESYPLIDDRDSGSSKYLFDEEGTALWTPVGNMLPTGTCHTIGSGLNADERLRFHALAPKTRKEVGE